MELIEQLQKTKRDVDETLELLSSGKLMDYIQIYRKNLIVLFNEEQQKQLQKQVKDRFNQLLKPYCFYVHDKYVTEENRFYLMYQNESMAYGEHAIELVENMTVADGRFNPDLEPKYSLKNIETDNQKLAILQTAIEKGEKEGKIKKGISFLRREDDRDKEYQIRKQMKDLKDSILYCQKRLKIIEEVKQGISSILPVLQELDFTLKGSLNRREKTFIVEYYPGGKSFESEHSFSTYQVRDYVFYDMERHGSVEKLYERFVKTFPKKFSTKRFLELGEKYSNIVTKVKQEYNEEKNEILKVSFVLEGDCIEFTQDGKLSLKGDDMEFNKILNSKPMQFLLGYDE